MTNALNRAGKRIGALILGMALAAPVMAQSQAPSPPVGPSQQEMAALMEMARQMIGMLPQMMKSLQTLEKEFERLEMAPYESLDLTPHQKDQVAQIQKDYQQVQAALAEQERDEAAKLQGLLSAERPDPAAVSRQQTRVDEVRRQRLIERITARNRVYDVLTERQREKLRQNEPPWLKDAAPLPFAPGTATP